MKILDFFYHLKIRIRSKQTKLNSELVPFNLITQFRLSHIYLKLRRRCPLMCGLTVVLYVLPCPLPSSSSIVNYSSGEHFIIPRQKVDLLPAYIQKRGGGGALMPATKYLPPLFMCVFVMLAMYMHIDIHTYT